ncbi:signal peptidase I [Falsarthrobacter nasiphocae]|uniref:Signal peptidase I n=1 Tax=Falsarthrobacter nasiphocae TaxID=189863 RepID=A0AAE3YIM7_9MICC|nr:signal peptidase I [Falsarthrobacter nasiphocae]MDR6892864.1 signal peptidase I [Falsarthrobacter nasiphocae]
MSSAAVPGSPSAPRRGKGSAKKENPSEPRTLGSWVKEILSIVVVALVLSFLFKTFIMRAFYIPSGSMESTLEVGDRIFVNKMMDPTKDLKRGDIVVFHDDAGWQPRTANPNPVRQALEFVGVFPGDSQNFLVKRVIGLPGDHVKTTSDGRISVNGKVIDEPYLYTGDRGSDIPFDVMVPADSLWVMGDHRSNSADSRYHTNLETKGFIPTSSVEGTGWFTALPLNRIKGLGGGESAFDGVPAPSSSSSAGQ